MEITPEFNEAAKGFDGDDPVTGTSGGPTPILPHDGANPVPAAHSETNFTRPFTAANQQTTPYGPRTPLTVEAAEDELGVLESGRAKPRPQKRSDPPTKLLMIVNTETEQSREARIRALRAYLAFDESDARITENVEGLLEPCR